MNERYREVCENRDWSVTVCDDGTVELEKYSPAGEDFIVAVDAENFVENVKKYAAELGGLPRPDSGDGLQQYAEGAAPAAGGGTPRGDRQAYPGA